MLKFLALVSILVTYVRAGGSEVCLNKRVGCVEYQITKDCCAAVDQSAHFEEISATCIPYTSNGINTGDMVDCCESRGAGSKGDLSVGEQINHKICVR
ncbi:hypothetical protein E3Q22_04171 [Wallemia mellicola]|uniref:Hydrophobin n=1 Tax=Wallemia mellicola TaxID=1708541 RepID=A0A4T0LWQ1_9BASI|nr:hypothetical protein E3Q22_04171 [Wallemia mellicola]TIB79369.1 hypothetical protein E3Q21_04125 [Wallemia mellicola]TIB83559.1 hypothetical protein E3Q20_04094 [Wallemia mellicola]TIB95850.1 hypothetical protein E3Q17_04121 [Wallemia mellicola]TIB99833.1 hypothetical protein E3Q16_04102 [Wallemia mellicola]